MDCTYCHQPLPVGARPSRNRQFHKDCYHEWVKERLSIAPYCYYCASSIEGKKYRDDGLEFHPVCYAKYLLWWTKLRKEE